MHELFHPLVALSAIIAVSLTIAVRVFAPRVAESWMHKFFRLRLFAKDFFANFNRTRLLRRIISEKKLRATPIRVLFPATDVNLGYPAVYFTNADPEELKKEAGVDTAFASEITDPGDLILALVATSALPLAFG